MDDEDNISRLWANNSVPQWTKVLPAEGIWPDFGGQFYILTSPGNNFIVWAIQQKVRELMVVCGWNEEFFKVK